MRRYVVTGLVPSATRRALGTAHEQFPAVGNGGAGVQDVGLGFRSGALGVPQVVLDLPELFGLVRNAEYGQMHIGGFLCGLPGGGGLCAAQRLAVWIGAVYRLPVRRQQPNHTCGAFNHVSHIVGFSLSPLME
ncbi:MAG: hypothetical protein BWX73_02164 [Lentisphaerae bacterium ADurb.Bin082]|nr:MAG: hypothetical protein BWX73_02164 [Lentisphaerae bacterium ADurb.Bin082]